MRRVVPYGPKTIRKYKHGRVATNYRRAGMEDGPISRSPKDFRSPTPLTSHHTRGPKVSPLRDSCSAKPGLEQLKWEYLDSPAPWHHRFNVAEPHTLNQFLLIH